MAQMRCPYFSLNVAQVPIPGLVHPMRVPVCRCALTEVLISRLVTHPEGQVLAEYLQAPDLGAHPRPVIGSDLQPITAPECTLPRNRDRCIPGFVEMLTELGVDTSLPPETERDQIGSEASLNILHSTG